jgi:hypothetical protein
MPAKSKKQRRAMAIAKHHPSKLYKKNRSLLKMSKKQLHEYASTKEKGLPKKKKKKSKRKK